MRVNNKDVMNTVDNKHLQQQKFLLTKVKKLSTNNFQMKLLQKVIKFIW